MDLGFSRKKWLALLAACCLLLFFWSCLFLGSSFCHWCFTSSRLWKNFHKQLNFSLVDKVYNPLLQNAMRKFVNPVRKIF